MKATTARSPSLLKRVVMVLAVVLTGFNVVAAVSLMLLIGDPDDNVDAVNEIVSTVSRESTAVTDGYLDAAESAGSMAARSVAVARGSLHDQLTTNTLRNVVAGHDNVDGAFVGLPNGDYLSVKKGPTAPDDGYRIRRIENADLPNRRVSEIRTDSSFEPVDEIEAAGDTYDPRSGPWYIAALERDRGWIDPHIFESSGEPGITHFRSVLSPEGELIAVVGVDVRLTAISDFLIERQPSEHGVAAIVSDEGSIISGLGTELDPELLRQLAAESQGLDSGSTLLTEWSTESELNVAALSRVGSDNQWTLAITAPQSDFVSDFDRQAGLIRDVIPVVGIVTTLGVAVMAVWALRRIDRLHDDATIDPLTGVLNRAEVRDRFGQLLEDSPDKLIAAIAIDFDDFKEINDVWGHLVGDQALVHLTHRLSEGIGEAGFTGRLGGDEFLVAWEVDTEEDAFVDITQLVESLAEPPISIDGATVRLPVSCGFSLRRPGEQVDLVTLLRNADLALLTAKSQTSNVVQYDREMDLPSIKDNELETELIAAVEGDEFEIHFQPEVDVADGTVIGAEALLRRRLSDGSFVPAKDFIADLERLHVIDRLTPMLLSQAERLAELIADPNFTVRLNFGSEQLRNAETLKAIASAQKRTVVGWCVEITERTIVESDAAMLRSLEDLVEQGVTLALDDFGTGYSSLAELGNLPISTVKIDRSFVSTLTLENAGSSLVSIIHDMAERLSLAVVAEGIETEEQRQALYAIGCRHGQGWLFGTAMPIDRFVSRLASRTAEVH